MKIVPRSESMVQSKNEKKDFMNSIHRYARRYLVILKNQYDSGDTMNSRMDFFSPRKNGEYVGHIAESISFFNEYLLNSENPIQSIWFGGMHVQNFSHKMYQFKISNSSWDIIASRLLIGTIITVLETQKTAPTSYENFRQRWKIPQENTAISAIYITLQRTIHLSCRL